MCWLMLSQYVRDLRVSNIVIKWMKKSYIPFWVSIFSAISSADVSFLKKKLTEIYLQKDFIGFCEALQESTFPKKIYKQLRNLHLEYSKNLRMYYNHFFLGTGFISRLYGLWVISIGFCSWSEYWCRVPFTRKILS